MSDPIVLVDTSEVLEGKLGELKTAMKGLVDFVETHEDRPLAYGVYFTDDGTRMTVVQVHPDPESMEFHMKVAAGEFSKVAPFVRIRAMDVYGEPSADLLEQMRGKAQMLGGITVGVHALHAGFSRFGTG